MHILPHSTSTSKLFHIFKLCIDLTLSKEHSWPGVFWAPGLTIFWVLIKYNEFVKICSEKCVQHLRRLQIQISTTVLPCSLVTENSLFVMDLTNELSWRMDFKFSLGISPQIPPILYLHDFSSLTLESLQCAPPPLFTTLLSYFSNSFFLL